MSNRVLTWHLSGVLGIGGQQGQVFYADRNYEVVEVRLDVSQKPTGAEVIVDINDDGSSLFDYRPNLPAGLTSSRTSQFAYARIGKDSRITLDIDQVGSGEQGKDLSVNLLLETI